MDVQLKEVLKEQEPILQNLLQFYNYEFSVYLDSIKLNSNGLYKPFNLQDYWTKPNYHPFFILINDELSGFVLIKSGTNNKPSIIEQFFTLRQYMGKGVGKIAAKKVFNLFPGKCASLLEKNNFRVYKR